jgi:ABC-type lipoprotein export system ATPase subunit
VSGSANFRADISPESRNHQPARAFSYSYPAPDLWFYIQQYNLLRGISVLENVMLPAYPSGESYGA